MNSRTKEMIEDTLTFILIIICMAGVGFLISNLF
jgi:hypothetical protein